MSACREPGERWLPRLVAAGWATLVLCACEERPAPVSAPPTQPPGSQWPGFEVSTPRSAARSEPGLFSGPFTEWHANGVKSGEGELVGGLRQGAWTFFHPSGVLRWRGTFERGVPVGPEEAWHENGSKQLEGTLVDGRREGIYRYWYDNGQLELEVEFRDDVRHGKCRRWSRDGVLDRSSSGVYTNGRKTGEL
ncbi:MAG: toxin-antitoxin system YwqK family antitoxin [Planctomycetaceae bacterium]|nr:toxin-antitoxin system YwqK family antitoxin [Planctomycetaceae bacterium]